MALPLSALLKPKSTVVNKTDKYIQDPNNPTASIPNPNYAPPTPSKPVVAIQPTTGGIIPPTPSALPGLGGEVAARALGAPPAEEEVLSPQDKLIEDLTTKLTAYTAEPTLTAEKKRLEEEKGILGMRERVGSFEEEMASTQTLLDQLEDDITATTRGTMFEAQRRRKLAAEQEPLMKQLGIAERGLAATTGRLARTEQDILTELGLIEKEKTMPLDLFERELNIRTKIKELATKDIPNVTTSQFNDEGDLTIVTQDPQTGAFSTQTIKGIGKKASEYENFSTVTNANGDVTVIGIKRDGTTQNLGVFKGAGPAQKVTTTDRTRVDDITTYFESVKNDQGKVSNEDYIAAMRNWISSEGNITDFKSAFPSDMIEESEFTRANISALYGIPDDSETSKFLGLELGWGKTNSEKLDDIMAVIKQYKDVGYTNADIMKKLQEAK